MVKGDEQTAVCAEMLKLSVSWLDSSESYGSAFFPDTEAHRPMAWTKDRNQPIPARRDGPEISSVSIAKARR